MSAPTSLKDESRVSAEEPEHLFSIARKVAGLFIVLAILLSVISALVISQVAAMQEDVDRLTEEMREYQLVHDILQLLGEVKVGVALAERLESARTELEPGILASLGKVRETLTELHRGPGSGDPSEASHQEDESEIFDLLDREVVAAAASLQDKKLSSQDEHLKKALEHARVLHLEMTQEFKRSRDNIQDRSRRLTYALLLTTAGSAVVLLLCFWFVRRSIVAPLHVLRQGATAFGSGSLDYRIHIRSQDELGDLAREFNHMADRLSQSHAFLEQEVRKRTRQFVQAAKLAEMGTLAAGVAHEINNPLASIASCSEALQRRLEQGQMDEADQREYLQIIAKEAYRARDITSGLLDFARQSPGPAESVKLGELVHEVALMEQHSLVEKGVELKESIASELPAIRGNPAELKQVLINLLRNASDASSAGGTISLGVQHVDGEVLVTVDDEGNGVDAADADRIFDPFFTTKASGAGTGLGLALAYRIIEGHGGNISVTDSPGGGARFTVHLPVAGEEEEEEEASA